MAENHHLHPKTEVSKTSEGELRTQLSLFKDNSILLVTIFSNLESIWLRPIGSSAIKMVTKSEDGMPGKPISANSIIKK